MFQLTGLHIKRNPMRCPDSDGLTPHSNNKAILPPQTAGFQTESEDSQVVDYDHRHALMLFARDYLDAEIARDEILNKRREL